jgi:hypothetical protein
MKNSELLCSRDGFRVVKAEKEFAYRRYKAEAMRSFEDIKADVKAKHGINIECCREVYLKAGKEIFALVGDILVDSYSRPPIIEP